MQEPHRATELLADDGPLTVLMLEDNPHDAELTEAVLRRNGLAFALTRVDSEADFLAALESDDFDIVLADYALPGYDGLSALDAVRERRPELPFIIVSGTLGEEPAIEALTRGATDYVIKQRLGRLGPSVRRAVSEARERTARLAAQNALEASERRFRALYDENPSMLFIVSDSGTILSINRFGAAQLGYSPETLLDIDIDKVHHASESETIRSHVARCFAEPKTTHRWEIRKRRADGQSMWVRETARAIVGADGEPVVLSVCEDTSEAHKLSAELSYQATHDPLTALVNRREFERRLARAIDSARGTDQAHALCYLDLDQFKVINDTCGHSAGDELLKQLAGIMRQRVRRADTLARLGGDEFAVLVESCSVEQARRLAEDLGASIHDFRFMWDGKVFSIGSSIGLVAIDAASGETSDVLAAADRACYAAKDQGRNRIHVYRPDDEDLQRRRGEMEWVSKLGAAIEEGRLRLARQPIMPLGDTEDHGAHFELLVRLEDESGELVPPGAFLPAAERYNLSTRLDRWVVATAMRWLASDPARLAGIGLCSINLSGQSLGDEAFLDFAQTCLSGSGVPLSKVGFEITETAAIANLDSAVRFASALRAQGVRFSLDDFGSGLSSFGYLKSLPVDYLKIDGIFVKDIVDDPIDHAMVRSINEIGHVMGKRTIAEFVESEAILAELETIGVDYVQGYAVGRPEIVPDAV